MSSDEAIVLNKETGSINTKAWIASTAAILTACGGGGGSESSLGSTSSGSSTNNGTNSTSGSGGDNSSYLPLKRISKPATEAEAARFLAQAGFGGDANARRALMLNGYESWLTEQLGMPQGLSRWDEATQLKNTDPTSFARLTEQIDNLLWKRIANSPDVLRQRMTLALSEIFVVNWAGVKVPMSLKVHALAAYMDLLERNAFGNFRQLLEDVTLNVAMGRMLGTWGNQKEDLKTNRQPDENYAREIMQLFSIGLYELNQDGSIKHDGQGQPIETYSLDTVSNLARVFTGWSSPLDYSSSQPDPEPVRRPMQLDPKRHSTLEKNFLGARIAANTDGQSSLKTALDTLFNHPNVGPFIGKQLIQRFVCSNPSPAYISRVAAAFADNGQGIRGDLKAVLIAVLLDSEARSAPNLSDAFAGKAIEPMVRIGQFFRSLKFTSPDGQWRLTRANAFGQQPLNAPSVFNFFRPGYIPPNSALLNQGKAAPELQIMNEQSVLNQANNYALILDDVGSYTCRTYYDAGGNYQRDTANTGLSLDLSTELNLVNNIDDLLEHLNLLLLAGQLSSTSKTHISQSVLKISDKDPAKQQLNRVKAAILLVLMSPEAQVLK
ncbi:DUF1800 domain-containing protein [Chitinibacter sp. SCUT-21]|uniref:DUF1800 domain-containing protein n=1 Tax=Chitinibacter sp. SCUT-21 TaxID=2970891 RepID=UPI0035A6B9EA